MLWRSQNFVLLWGAESLSRLGSQVSVVALPLAALVTLDASPAQVGFLPAAEFVPVLLVALPAGLIADRYSRRALMVGANLGRAVALGLVPLLFVLGGLEIGWLYAIAFTSGCLTVLFDICYQSAVPQIVAREHLAQANSALQASYSAGQVGGRALGGGLVSLVGAPAALLADAVSYFCGALALLFIRETHDAEESGERPARSEGGTLAGLRWTFRNRFLRVLALISGWFNIFEQMLLVALAIYVVRTLGLSAAALGIVLAAGGAGSVVGSLLASRASKRFGVGPCLGGGMLVAGALPLAIPAFDGATALTIVALALVVGLYNAGLGLFNVHALSVRQGVPPPALAARVQASYRWVSFGGIPIGAALGGVIADAFGARAALAVAGGALAVGAVTFSRSQLARTKSYSRIAPSTLVEV